MAGKGRTATIQASADLTSLRKKGDRHGSTVESTVRYLGIEVDDALATAEQTEV